MADQAWHDSFLAFAEGKTREADAAALPPLETRQATEAWPSGALVGNSWTRRQYDGAFALPPIPDDRPSISLVFVQSRDGNTEARNPASLGGGAIDQHLIYEGLARVAADAVMAGAATAAGRSTFFSVWRRELIDLRASLGLPRHPVQIVVSNDGHLDVEGSLLFNVPEARVIVIAGSACVGRCGEHLASRPWITVVPMGHDGWAGALPPLRHQHGIARISAVGGRRTATTLIDAGVVQDICLTTTRVTGGKPDTPFYAGSKMPLLELIARKESSAEPNPILFEHLRVR